MNSSAIFFGGSAAGLALAVLCVWALRKRLPRARWLIAVVIVLASVMLASKYSVSEARLRQVRAAKIEALLIQTVDMPINEIDAAFPSWRDDILRLVADTQLEDAEIANAVLDRILGASPAQVEAKAPPARALPPGVIELP